MEKILLFLLFCVSLVVMSCVMGLLLALPVMLLWNYLGLAPTDFTHAWALVVLCTLLFKVPARP